MRGRIASSFAKRNKRDERAGFAADSPGMVNFASRMEKTLQVLNALERDGVLSRYAIGGAMGATFYVEPVLTFDLDIFVILPQTAYGLLTLEPLYENRILGQRLR